MKLDVWLGRVTYFSILWVCFFLPLKTTLSNVGLILLLLSTVISFAHNGIRKEVFSKPTFYTASTMALFIPILIGFMYAPSFVKASAQLGKCFFYAAIPLILLRNDIARDKAILWGSKGLLFGGTIGLVYLFFNNTSVFIESGLPLKKILSYNFTGKSFVAPLREMHPVYFGSYILFSLFLIWQTGLKLDRVLKILLTSLMLLGLLFLNSRILFFTGIFLLILVVIRNISLKRSLIVLGVMVLFFTLVIPSLKGTYVYNKIVQGSRWDMTVNIGSQNLDQNQISDSRMSRWIVSKDLFLQKPLFGHGTAAARDLLVEAYSQRDMKTSEKQSFDSHNQYLGYAIDYGLIGLFFLACFFGINLIVAIRKKDVLLLVFTLLIGSLCLTENYLIRNMGINFVAIFGNLLILKEYD